MFKQTKWLLGFGLCLIILIIISCTAVTYPQEQRDIISHSSTPGAIRDYMIKFRDITDQTAPSEAEKSAITQMRLTGKIDLEVIDSILAKATEAVRRIKDLNPPTECQEIHELGIRFYQVNADIYSAYKEAIQGSQKAMIQTLDLGMELQVVGPKLDAGRRVIHEKYNLGRL